MDTVIERSIRLVRAKTKREVPWPFDKPYSQAYHTYHDGKWVAHDALRAEVLSNASTTHKISRLALYSWNIDFMLPFPDSRMRAAIAHLKRHVSDDPEAGSTGTLIYLQESVASDLQLLAADPWIQQTFHLTDVDPQFWQSGHYGTVTLVDRRLPVAAVFRVHYAQTRMERDALFVDVDVATGGGERGRVVVRFCNTHLESLALEPAYRPPQLALAAEYMHSDEAVDAAVLAGDLNAIQDFDRSLHTDNGLKDAFLELGGREDDAEAGHTWGQQAATHLRERFGTCRMDKVFFCGRVRLEAFERFGGDVVLADPTEQEEVQKLGFDKAWITDHLGIKAVFTIPAGE